MGCVMSPVRVRTPRLVMNETAYEKLLNAAFRFVSFRPRSEKELRGFLAKKLKAWNTYAPTMVDTVIARMVEYGHVDDAKFAQWWVEQRMAFRPKGVRLLVLELRKKGISKEVAESVLTLPKGDLEPYNELESAKKAVERKIALWSRLSPKERITKLSGFLGRRGFSSATIRHLIDEAGYSRYNTK